jgi:hypothetical protein
MKAHRNDQVEVKKIKNVALNYYNSIILPIKDACKAELNENEKAVLAESLRHIAILNSTIIEDLGMSQAAEQLLISIVEGLSIKSMSFWPSNMVELVKDSSIECEPTESICDNSRTYGDMFSSALGMLIDSELSEAF